MLVPLVTEALAAPKPDPQLIEDLVGLIALVPEPAPPPTRRRRTAWKKMHGGAAARRASARRRRWRTRNAPPRRASARNPPPMIKKVNFCNAAAAAFPTSGIEPQ